MSRRHARTDIRTDTVRREIARQTVTSRPLDLRPRRERVAWRRLWDSVRCLRKWI